MKAILLTITLFFVTLPMSLQPEAQEFQGKAYYASKSKMELGSWGARMSEAQKKETYARLKNRLEKTYILDFNKTESVFNEEVKMDAMSGATDTWGANFARGEQYKNVKENQLVQSQEFYGKKFLVKDKLQEIDWQMGSETKQVGKYTTFKATASVPTADLTWYDFSWGDLRTAQASDTASADGETAEPEVPMTEVEAWYTLQIPVSHGPGEYWGLPGLILEVSAGNMTMLCSKVVINPGESIVIEAPDKGKEITKADYQSTVRTKMQEMRDNRGRRRG
ncbi:GLPGLI family protein [Dokdonia sinensis]|uniref:GLPGLI family protein n=1 Tax=Dokdonia sinensis TaxID=2479847 RepID=A0A3M0GGK8_9FLAO|nr:GLPGLI family protein [Dokdonia sinensis]RMB63418.1 GLPGLI family protein [Dokdonia sinensis]